VSPVLSDANLAAPYYEYTLLFLAVNPNNPNPNTNEKKQPPKQTKNLTDPALQQTSKHSLRSPLHPSAKSPTIQD